MFLQVNAGGIIIMKDTQSEQPEDLIEPLPGMFCTLNHERNSQCERPTGSRNSFIAVGFIYSLRSLYTR